MYSTPNGDLSFSSKVRRPRLFQHFFFRPFVDLLLPYCCSLGTDTYTISLLCHPTRFVFNMVIGRGQLLMIDGCRQPSLWFWPPPVLLCCASIATALLTPPLSFIYYVVVLGLLLIWWLLGADWLLASIRSIACHRLSSVAPLSSTIIISSSSPLGR